MNNPATEFFSQNSHRNSLICPDTAWDCAKSEIVSRMTGQERQAMLRGTTRDLIKHSPAIQEGMRSYDRVRKVVAESMVTQLQISSGMEAGIDQVQFARHKEKADQQMAEIREITNLYRQATGYRACCVWQLDTDNTLDSSCKNDILTLSNMQSAHYRVLLIIDMLKHINKAQNTSQSEGGGFDFNSLKTRFCDDLDKHCQLMSKGLSTLETTLNGSTASEIIAEIDAQAPQSNDARLNSLNKAHTVGGVFRTFNLDLTEKNTLAINEYLQDNNLAFGLTKAVL